MIEDGDYVLIATIMGADATWGYSSSLWTDESLLNEEKALEEEANAKYETFITQKFLGMRICVDAPTSNCVEHRFGREFNSATELFNAGFIKDTNIDEEGLVAAFGATGHKDCEMQKPGFNV